MASNQRTLADEDGNFSDWIEIQNVSTAAASLSGYFLTDNPADLAKWAFPDVTVEPGATLLVFASGNNRTNPAGRLHTNFQLDSNGEFLALVQGTNVVQLFNPFPPQKEDVAYGIAQQVVTTPLLADSTPQILVPASAADLAANWNQLEYTPGPNWFTGAPPAAIGFDTNKSASAPGNVAPSGTAVQSTTLSSYTANLGINGNLGDFTHTMGTDNAPFWQLTLTNNFSISRVILYNRTSCCGSRLRDITVQILSTNASGTVTNWQSPLLNPENAGYSYPNGPANITVDLVALTGGPVIGRIVRVSRTPDPDLSGSGNQGNSDEAAVLSLGEVVVEGVVGSDFGQYIRTDIQPQMLNQNASAFVRLPFVLTNAVAPDRLTLQMRYDDGFIAYLNGVEVARRNAPADPGWDASAVTNRTFAGASLNENIDITANAGLLVNGTNLLAIQALNYGATNADFLVVPALNYTFLLVSSNAYLVDATPGAVNDTEFYYGEVADTQFSVDRGFFDAPFSLVITSATPGATIYYSFNGDEPGPTKGLVYTGPLTITNTTVVRARAFKAGLKPTAVDTHTYLFLGDVIYQSPTGAPPPYFPASWGRNRVDYGMDPNVVNLYNTNQWREALTQVATISIVTELPNLFDPTTGIYANADGHGEEWERPASIELLDPTNAVPGRFQEPCGLRIRGGYSRNASFVKHSLRVFFRREYGTPRLHYPLFENEGATEFDTFDLRTSQNYAWPRETSASNGGQDTMVREVFCRETLGAMGQPYRRSRYYHLYLNGQYWGLYETDERPEASYGEIYFGGKKEDYDVVKCANHVGNFVTEVTDGNFTAWSNLWVMVGSLATDSSNSNYFRILGCNPDGTRNRALPVMLDVDNLIDYMLGIFYTGDGDATLSAFLSNNRPNNWFGMRNRNDPDMGFRFFNSDCEHTLGAPSSQVDRTGPFSSASGSNLRNFTYSNPQYLHEDLMRNAEYRLRFADHVQKHFFNNGVLTPAAATNRFLNKAAQINKAIRAYSARWGDAAPHEPPYGETEWVAAINSIVNGWFPGRTATVLQQLKVSKDTVNYPYFVHFPSVGAPAFSQPGGHITNGYQLTMTQSNAGGVIYFTLDGSDPRKVGGAVSGSALAYSGPVTLSTGTRVKARVLSGTTWSALNQADFIAPEIMALRVTEIMYHPSPVTPVEYALGITNADDFEYIELRNVGATTLTLAGVTFVDGISFTFTEGTLAAGERLVLVKNVMAFTNRFGATARIGGVYAGNLNNAGEHLQLQDAAGRVIQSFSYSDGWYPVTDGHGFSLTIVDDTAPVGLWDMKSSWQQSSTLNGSPGGANLAPPLFPYVVINELLTRPLPGDKETVELANLGATPADISGWWLTDDIQNPQKYRLPTNTVVPAGGFLLITEDEFKNPALGVNAFSWGGMGGEVRLFSANANGDLTGYYQGWDFGPADEGVTFGRHVISTGTDQFPPQAVATLGTTNAGPRVGPVVISEIMYHPPDVGGADNTADEFLELANITTNTVTLFDPANPTNTWRITGGVDFVFPTDVALAPGERLLVLNFDPVADPVALERFRQQSGFATNLQVVGPYRGRLNNAEDTIELKHPTTYLTGFSGYTMVDKVAYHDQAPWPAGADGLGASLQRVQLDQYGNDPANWQAAMPTAGNVLPGGTPPALTQEPVAATVLETSNVTFTAAATGAGTLAYLWRFNGQIIATNFDGVLSLQNVQLTQQGDYSVAVLGAAGVVVSSNATLTVLPLPKILVQPVGTNVLIGSNATLAVTASGTGVVTYQWQKDGVDLPGANQPTLVISNVQVSHEGLYRVVITDTIATRVSQEVRMQPIQRLRWVQTLPSSRTTNAGVDVEFTATLAGYPPPFTWQFKRLNPPPLTVLEVVVNDQTNQTFRLTNVQFTNSGTYQIVASNLATAAISSASTLTVLSPPVITGQPTNQVAAAGSNAVFAVTAVGTAPLRYQWYFQETNLLAGATNTSLTVSNVTAGVNEGGYSVVVSNTLGVVTSLVAQLTLDGSGDADGDGLPDAWEALHGFGAGNDHDADPDADGRSNWEEYISGTNPTNALSVLKVALSAAGGGGATVSFTAMPNIGYSILYQTNLADATWLKLTNVPPQTGTNWIQVTDPAARANRTIYYRIATPPLP